MITHAPVPMIRSSVVNQVIAAIQARPGGASFLRRERDIKSTSSDLYDLIALGRYLRLFEDAAALAGDPLFGAGLGNSLPPGELLGPIRFLVLTSPRLRVGLAGMGLIYRGFGGMPAQLLCMIRTARRCGRIV